jgi:hypothetical protein
LVRPPVVTELRLPGPEDPTIRISLILQDLCREPVGIKSFVPIRLPSGSPLHRIWDAETELANDRWALVVTGECELAFFKMMSVGLPVSVVMARVVHIGTLIDCDRVVPLDVSVVIVGHEILVGHELIGGSRAPQLIHGLHVQIVVSCDT